MTAGTLSLTRPRSSPATRPSRLVRGLPSAPAAMPRAKKDAISGEGMTQFGRAPSELNIEIRFANLSQAKGRAER